MRRESTAISRGCGAAESAGRDPQRKVQLLAVWSQNRAEWRRIERSQTLDLLKLRRAERRSARLTKATTTTVIS